MQFNFFHKIAGHTFFLHIFNFIKCSFVVNVKIIVNL